MEMKETLSTNPLQVFHLTASFTYKLNANEVCMPIKTSRVDTSKQFIHLLQNKGYLLSANT
jgi:hypothetical protein